MLYKNAPKVNKITQNHSKEIPEFMDMKMNVYEKYSIEYKCIINKTC